MKTDIPSTKPERQQTISEAAAAGDRFATLQTIRNRLAHELENACEPRDIAILALRLTDVLEQIDSMPTSVKASVADEIAKRRAARRGSRTARAARASRAR